MKKFAILIVVALLAISSAWAEGSAFNPTKEAKAQFDVIVIQPIGIEATEDITLPDLIKGQKRTFAAQIITFDITGQGNHGILVTKDAIVSSLGTATGGSVKLTSEISPLPEALVDGKASVVWSCTAADAELAEVGTYLFALKVYVSYTGF